MLLREQNKGSGQDRSHSGQLLVLGLKIKVWGTSKAAQYMIHVKQGIYGLWYLNPMLMIDMILNTRMDKLSKMLDTQISLVSSIMEHFHPASQLGAVWSLLPYPWVHSSITPTWWKLVRSSSGKNIRLDRTGSLSWLKHVVNRNVHEV